MRNPLRSPLFMLACLLAVSPAPVRAQTGFRPPASFVEIVSTSGLDSIRNHLIAPDGGVVKVTGGKAYITNDNGAVLERGRTLTIVRETEPIIHPVTGEKLGAITEPVGRVSVVSSDGKLITARIETGGDAIKPGDRIGAPDAPPRVALVMNLAVRSWDAAGVTQALARRLAEWRHVTWAPRYAVERFLYDQNVSGRTGLVRSETFQAARKLLDADYLIVLDVKETEDSALIDMALYALAGDLTPLASYKGLAALSGAARATTTAPEAPTGREPETSLKPAAPPAVVIAPASAAAEKAPPPVPVPAPEPRASAPPATPAPPPVKKLAGKVKSRLIGEFDDSIAALLSHDLDGDGVNEVIVGFNHRIVVFRLKDWKLERMWELRLHRRSQVIGLCAGDFNGNGAVEVYVNNTVNSSVRSLVFERGGGSFKVIREKQSLLFYAGADGKLYGRGQLADFSFEKALFELGWKGKAFEEKPFLALPPRKRLAGLGLFDLDGDSVTDIAGIDQSNRLIFFSSAKNEWKQVSGMFGGTNVTIKLEEEYEPDVYQAFPSPVLVAPGAGGIKELIAVRNSSPLTIISYPTYDKGQVVILDHDGVAYTETLATPFSEGAIQGAALLGASTPNLLLVGRTHPAMFGKDKSELILMDLSLY